MNILALIGAFILLCILAFLITIDANYIKSVKKHKYIIAILTTIFLVIIIIIVWNL